MARPSHLRRPKRVWAVAAVALVGGLTATAVFGLGWWVGWAYAAAVNAAAFAFCGLDKLQARRGGGRIPEVVLHGLALFGGSPALAAAMRLFRHKTIKSSFRLVFWGLVAFQTAVVAYLVWTLKVHS
jgi:uncharacterized membrane protein YsdA (DUF1294 family)